MMVYTLHYSETPMGQVFYILRNMVPGSYHRVEGQMNVTAYRKQTSRRAKYSIKVNASSISPLTFDFNTVPANAQQCLDITHDKGLFIIKTYILQHWSTFVTANADGVKFAQEVVHLYNALVGRNMIVKNCCPCEIFINIKEVKVNPQFPKLSLEQFSLYDFSSNVALSIALVEEQSTCQN